MGSGAESERFASQLESWRTGGEVDPSLAELFSGAYRFEHVTADALSKALEGFALPLTHGCSMEWLAGAVQRAMAAPLEADPSLEEDKPAVTTRKNITSLAERATDLQRALDNLGEAEFSLISRTFQRGRAWQSYRNAKHHLKFLAGALSVVAGSVPVLKRGPRPTATELRTRQAECLMPVYGVAFDKQATVNDRPNALNLGPWPDFFARTYKLATGKAAKNITDILKEARTREIRRELGAEIN